MKSFELTEAEIQEYRNAVDEDDRLQRSIPTLIPTFAFQAMNRVLENRKLKGEAEKVTITFHHPWKTYHLWYSEPAS